ncbi:DUF429 domain-containing protein [Pelotomaculum propionicicum]|nr:DUF429 domain-containing protein [Pelotomaculum propionicicum]NLI13991.1 DUF429 domain-containing protein [Peptococcaceae bacterium]
MDTIYLGVDIAGATNTWVGGVCPMANGLNISFPPKKQSLADIVRYAEQNNVVAVAIDAQLTSSINDENGFRSSDLQLRGLLPPKFKVWVASQNSMMAVPIRGRQLAEALSPCVGTIIETHPRSCLHFANPDIPEVVQNYKKDDGEIYRRTLWERWIKLFNINGDISEISDGALDSIVCATVAYLFHQEPSRLLKLQYSEHNKTGRGPFYVLYPEFN